MLAFQQKCPDAASPSVTMQLIDRCAHMQNLREAILSYRRGLTHEADEARREAALHRGIQYLERYFTLCAFAAYVHDPSFTAASSAAADGSFQAWMGRRPELQSILRRLLWRNPMGALTQPVVQQAVSAALPHHADSGEVADAVVTGRAGAVLGAHCILKEEPYPGVHVSSLPVLHEGAPNFRQVRLSLARATRSTRLNCHPLSASRRCLTPSMVSLLQRWTASVPCSPRQAQAQASVSGLL